MELRTGSESEVTLSETEASLRLLGRRHAPNTLIPGPGLDSSVNPTSLFNFLRGRNGLKDRVDVTRKMFDGDGGGGSPTLSKTWARSHFPQEGKAGGETHPRTWLLQDSGSPTEGM